MSWYQDINANGWPIPTHQETEIDCPLCRGKIRILRRCDLVNWQAEADKWRELYENATTEYSRILADVEAMYGADNPVIVYYRNRIDFLVSKLKRLIEEDEE